MLVSLYVTCYGSRIPKLTGCPLKSARRDSAVLLDRSILLYDKQAISVKLSESSWFNILLNVSLLEFSSFDLKSVRENDFVKFINNCKYLFSVVKTPFHSRIGNRI